MLAQQVYSIRMPMHHTCIALATALAYPTVTIQSWLLKQGHANFGHMTEKQCGLRGKTLDSCTLRLALLQCTWQWCEVVGDKEVSTVILMLATYA